MRRLVPILALLALAILAAVALAQVDGEPAARATVTAASGSFEISNSADGQPIFAATDLGPGGSAEGTVTIADTGTAAVALVLRRGELVDSPGLGGGVLSDQLRLRVLDVTVPAAPRTVYAGPLATMPEQHAAEFGTGEARTFEFSATLPEHGEPGFENSLQGASTTIAYTWVAEEAEGRNGEEGGNGSGGGGQGSADTVGGGGQGEGGGAPGDSAALDLTVSKVGLALRRGRLVAWTRCDRPCRLTVRGRRRATAAGHHPSAPIRFAQKRVAPAGVRRLPIPIPPKLTRWVRQAPPPKRLRAKLRFVATDSRGETDTVHMTLRLRIRGD
jgi:hypothetical protein